MGKMSVPFISRRLHLLKRSGNIDDSLGPKTPEVSQLRKQDGITIGTSDYNNTLWLILTVPDTT